MGEELCELVPAACNHLATTSRSPTVKMVKAHIFSEKPLTEFGMMLQWNILSWHDLHTRQLHKTKMVGNHCSIEPHTMS